MDVRVVDSIDAVPAAQWNALAGLDNPFLRHELISAFERTGCAVPKTGWRPQHLAVYDGAHLVGAAPIYVKSHTYGEFVFDFAWAEAYRRAGLQYYPKLISAIPFSPVTGPRLLTADHPRREAIAGLLIDAAIELADRTGASSVHWLFPRADDMRILEGHGMLRRDGFQYHWLNPGYRDFDDFLSTFNAQKRKKTRRERRHVAEAGVTIEVLEGRAITAAHWDLMHDFHQATIQLYGAPPFLTRAFFRALAESMPENAMLVLARHGREYVGGALNLVGSEALYGRYWGGRAGYNSLHFEVCYYSAIDYCIAKGLKRFEGGAGGEHKLSRGFVPVPTYSAHWLRHPQFARAVADFLARERNGIELYLDELNEHTPFKKAAG
jgi:predicted N-acyltransferase